MKLAAFLHGVRIAVRRARCPHDDMKRASVTVVGRLPVYPVMVCRRCGWTDLQPHNW